MLSWKNDQLQLWLKNAQYDDDVVDAFRSHNITGMTLPLLNTEELKEMGVADLRVRLRLMSDINDLLMTKGSNGLMWQHPMLTQLQSSAFATTLVNELSQNIKQELLENDSKSLAHQFDKLREDLLPVLKEIKNRKPLPTPTTMLQARKSSYFATAPASPVSPVSPDKSVFSQETSMTQAEVLQASTTAFRPQRPTLVKRISEERPKLVSQRSSGSVRRSNSSKRNSAEPLQQLRARTEDKCYKIIQAAMKSHGLDISEWNNYALVIVYGDQERVLDYEEKPVVVFRELSEMGLNPSMMLRQIDKEDGFHEFDTPGGRL